MTEADLTDVKHHYEVYVYAKAKEAEFKAMKERAKEELDDVMGDADLGLINGKPVLEYKKTFPKKLSVADIRKQYPEIAAELQTEEEQRSLHVLGGGL